MIISYVSTAMEKEDFITLFSNAAHLPGQQAQKFNRLIMEGLAANGVEVHACTGRPVTKKNCQSKYLHAQTHVKDDKLIYLYGAVLNLPILKNLWQMLVSYFTICREARKGSEAVICDVLNVSISFGATLAARHKKIPCIGIVTDLPKLMVTGGEKQSKWRKSIGLAERVIQKCTGYILLTEAMSERMNPENKPYIVIEGLCDMGMQHREKKPSIGNSKKKCIYAGYLNARYGVKMMVDGFILADLPNVELHIFGDGPYAEELTRVTKEYPNVIYHGTVMNDVVVQAELEADLLINPRPTHEEFTKYSFPSKNMEYMATGIPVLTTCLPGMPEEYKQYVYLLEDETDGGVCQALMQIFEKSDEERNEKGLQAKRFVLEKKNNVCQAQKIMELICCKNHCGIR